MEGPTLPYELLGLIARSGDVWLRAQFRRTCRRLYEGDRAYIINVSTTLLSGAAGFFPAAGAWVARLFDWMTRSQARAWTIVLIRVAIRTRLNEGRPDAIECSVEWRPRLLRPLTRWDAHLSFRVLLDTHEGWLTRHAPRPILQKAPPPIALACPDDDLPPYSFDQALVVLGLDTPHPAETNGET